METVEKRRSGGRFGGLGGERWGLGIFAKEPRAGRVKTRLVPPLSAEEAMRLYRVALAETVARFGSVVGRTVLYFDGGEDYFLRSFPWLERRAQADGDLGVRMERALAQLLADGCTAAALIGSDSPDLPLEQVTAGFAALSGAEAVTIPASDGGYVFIGIRRPLPELFTDIPWSSPEVLARTREAARQAGIAYLECGGWEDLDDVAALTRLCRRAPQSATARFLAGTLSSRLDLRGRLCRFRQEAVAGAQDRRGG